MSGPGSFVFVAAALTLTLVLVFALSACGGVTGSSFGHFYKQKTKHYTVDGVPVTCVVFETDKGTLSAHCWTAAELHRR